MISASYDQRDPFRDPHAGDPAFVRKLQRLPKCFGGTKRNRLLHRPVRNAALSGQYSPIRHKSSHTILFQPAAYPGLVFSQLDLSFQSAGIQAFVQQRLLNSLGKKCKKNLLQLSCIDRASVGRKSDMKPDDKFFFRNLTRTPFQNLLGAAADRDQAALPGAFRLERKLPDCLAEASEHIICQGGPCRFFLIIFRRKTAH